LGIVLVKGLTAKELEAKITELLAQDYLVNPQVSVFIREHAKYSILGEIKGPGTYELKAGLTLMDAIALVGGFTQKANTEEVKLVRIKSLEKQTLNINTKEIVEEGRSDVVLEPGDLIIISALAKEESEEDIPEFVVVLGQVRSPGRYNYKKGMTVIEAVALAGGLSETAAANGTKIIRMEDGQKRTISIPLGSILKGGDRNSDISLEPDDTIVVPESFF
jgi:polysaccharide export outer membrane protein